MHADLPSDLVTSDIEGSSSVCIRSSGEKSEQFTHNDLHACMQYASSSIGIASHTYLWESFSVHRYKLQGLF